MDSNCGSANSARNRPIPLNLLSPQGATTQSARQGVFDTHLKALLAELDAAFVCHDSGTKLSLKVRQLLLVHLS